MTTKNRNIVFGYLTLEFLLLNLCILFVLYSLTPGFLDTNLVPSSVGDIYRLLLVFNLGWALIVFSNGNFDFHGNSGFRKRTKAILINTFIFIGITYTSGMLLGLSYFDETTFLIPIFLFSFINIFFLTTLYNFFNRKKPSTLNSNALIVGAGKKWEQYQGFTEKIQVNGYNIIGFLENEEIETDEVDFEDTDYGIITATAAPVTTKKTNGINVLGSVSNLSEVLDTQTVDEIFIRLSSLNKTEIKHAVETADFHGIRVNLIPETPNFLGANIKSSSLEDLPVFQLRSTPLDNFHNFLLKKTFDFLFALTVLIVLSPVFLIIALLIYLHDRGPILYTPLRKGEEGRAFKCYKFRTMSECDNPINGTRSTVKNDPRITPIGRFMRKYDLDELPQFFNVLKGDMSVVGPRPHRINLQNDFRKIINDYMVRHYVKPGISGWAQVNGWRGPTQTIEQKKERIDHDLWYIENWSFFLDIKIVFLTVFGKKTRKNAF